MILIMKNDITLCTYGFSSYVNKQKFRMIIKSVNIFKYDKDVLLFCVRFFNKKLN